ASLGEARAALRKQKSPDGGFMNVAPAFLVCGADRETAALQLLSEIQAASADNAVPAWIKAMQLVVEPRLDASGAWFLTGNPAVDDIVEVSYLDGRNRPQIQQAEDFDTAALRWRVSFDFGAAALDWRAIFMNPGD